MENNQILVGIRFKNNSGFDAVVDLYILRDIGFFQLCEGIKYGLQKMIESNNDDSETYKTCLRIFREAIAAGSEEDNEGRAYYKNITLYNHNNFVGKRRKNNNRSSIYVDETSNNKKVCDLGFITSTRLVFLGDDIGSDFVLTQDEIDSSAVIEAFSPLESNEIFFPEYNISTRQLYQFDSTPVNVISPSEPPQKSSSNLFMTIFTAVLSIGIMSFAGGSMVPYTRIAMGVIGIVTAFIGFVKAKNDFSKNLAAWKEQYVKYVKNLTADIFDRQRNDISIMEDLHPDFDRLVGKEQYGIYTLNDRIFSRSVNDKDFLTVRLGRSNDVLSTFEVSAENKEEIFSTAFYRYKTSTGKGDDIELYTLDEIEKQGIKDVGNLSSLPLDISRRYKFFKNAPLLYSLKNKKAVGLVDTSLGDSVSSFADAFISKMIFELCYYHSPEDLQFVIFFPNETEWNRKERKIINYKYMPHFHGLFSDKSQFAFDEESANEIMSDVMRIVNARSNEEENEDSSKKPHIVFIVFNEHGLKEHAFAEFLPEPPINEEDKINKLGLTFVFAKKHKEYLPKYCDDVIYLEENNCYIAPHDNMLANQRFVFNKYFSNKNGSNEVEQLGDFTKTINKAFGFFSSVYYEKIAQNGKVPSSVSGFQLFDVESDSLSELIKNAWEENFKSKKITKSLRVPIGLTETDTAYLDLHEKADGPHMLVAGTTGSGKTETIITYLIGLCMTYRPDELNLLLVDMKGGGFTKRLGNLPHVVGMVTDVDGDENGTGAVYMLRRFLFAVQSEVKRRKILFNDLYVDSIDGYISACRNIESHVKQKKLTGNDAKKVYNTAKNNPLSHLVIVIDEFTELKRFSSENDDVDFMSEITTIARVGRSLGLHIILISQNIEGAITDDIRVNSKSRLCLKVATKQASKEMLGTDLAASPNMPGNGRAYLMVGTGSRFEYFQSGYTGVGSIEDMNVNITLVSKSGLNKEFYNSDKDNKEQKRKREAEKEKGLYKTQLEIINEAIISTFNGYNTGEIKRHIVFSPPLAKKIVLGSNGRPKSIE